MIVSEYQYTETFLLWDILKTGPSKFFSLAMVKKLQGVFMKKNCKKLVRKNQTRKSN